MEKVFTNMKKKEF